MWMLPFVNLIWVIWGVNLLVKKFGKTTGFTVGVLMLGVVFIPILAFGSAQYEDLEEGDGTGTAQASMIDMADKILVIVISFLFITALMRFLLNILHINLYEGFARYIELVFSFISAFIPVALGLVVKDKIIRIVCIILAVLYMIFVIYSNVGFVRYLFYG